MSQPTIPQPTYINSSTSISEPMKPFDGLDHNYNIYYAQVEALNRTKTDNETVRHFVLKIQQLVEKGWCNENASTINLKCNKIFTKGLPKNLKDLK